MTPRAVDRDPDDLRAESGKLVLQLAVERELVAADGAPIRRIEHEDCRPAEQVVATERLVRIL
jgi:hypothetical protein